MRESIFLWAPMVNLKISTLTLNDQFFLKLVLFPFLRSKMPTKAYWAIKRLNINWDQIGEKRKLDLLELEAINETLN